MHRIARPAVIYHNRKCYLQGQIKPSIQTRMLAFDDMIYLDPPRTASTQIRNAFKLCLLDPPRHDNKHAGLDFKPAGYRVWMSIRDPLDHYVSHWAWCCEGYSNIRLWIAKSAPEYERLFANVTDRPAFNEWVQLMNDPRWIERALKREKFYIRAGLHEAVGFLSYRYLQAMIPSFEWFVGNRFMKDASFSSWNRETVQRLAERHSAVDGLIRYESMATDVSRALETTSAEKVPEHHRLLDRMFAVPMNKTDRPPATDLFDDDTLHLLREREIVALDCLRYEVAHDPAA